MDRASPLQVETNHGKRTLALELDTADGKARLWELLQAADVLIDGFTQGSLAHHGFAIDAVLERNPHLVYLDLSSHMFFRRPGTYGTSTVDRVLSWEPDLVLGVDYLFWFVYGTMPEESRLAFLEKGLAQLDRIASLGIPMVIGEVPDLEGTESFVIGAHQIPTRQTTILANRRINEWAATRDTVAVVPLQRLTDQLAAGDAIVVGSHHWNPREEGIEMIAVDKLHPTFDGMICLAQAVEAAARSIDSIRSDTVRLPPMELDRDALVTRMRVRRLKPRRTAGSREDVFSTS